MTDPKPNLSQAAIKSNIVYWQAICLKYRLAQEDSEKELAKWEQQLNEISPNTNK